MIAQRPLTAARLPLAFILASTALVIAVGLFSPPDAVRDLLRFGEVSSSDSMHRAKWYGPAAEELVRDHGASARVHQVNVYEHSVTFHVATGDGARVFHVTRERPRSLRRDLTGVVTTPSSFPASVLDPRAPERIVAAAKARAGEDFEVSLLRLERAPEGGAPRWQVLGRVHGEGVAFEASADGRTVR